MLALSVLGALVTGRAGTGGQRHLVTGLLVASVLALMLPLLLRARRLGPTRVAAASAVVGLVLIVVLAGSGALVLAGEEQWAASLVNIGTGVRAHAVHDLASWALTAWIGLHVPGALLYWARHPPLGRAEAVATAVALTTTGSVLLSAPVRPPAATQGYVGSDATWEVECGDCHLAYPPDLLPARSWALMVDQSADHFGEDLGLEPGIRSILRAWLVANAAERDATEHAWRIHHSVPDDAAPQRITELSWWLDAHAAVPAEAFDHPDIRTPGRCQGCHLDAASGAFQVDTHFTMEKHP
jgi:hypothetical protein